MKDLQVIILSLLLFQIILPVIAIQHTQAMSYNTVVAEPFVSPPVGYYPSGELPVGIATYGSNPAGWSGASYTIETTQWLGIVTIDSLSATSNNQNCPYSVSFQLNVVLNYEYNGNTYALWVQDVALFDTQNQETYIIDNIWNVSALYANVTGVHGNGSIYTATVNGHTVTFYAYASSSSYTTLSLPATIYLLVNVTTNSQGQPVIYFWYSYGSGWVNYDVVTVTNVVDASNVYFLVQPGETPGDIYYDAALIIGGPGNGANANIQSGTVYFQLFYWNGHNFQEPLYAYSVGYDTAETVSNANTQLYVNSSNGELYAELVVGQTPSLETLWDPNSVVQLTVYSSISSGIVYLYNYNLIYPQATQVAYKVPFVGGQATVTLYPGKYAILVYQNGQPIAEANINGEAGQSISTDTTQFSVSLNETQLTLYPYESGGVSITVKAYGDVVISVVSPSSIKTSFTQQTVYISGQDTIDLTIYPTQAGTYTVIINASIFPGFYVTQQLTIIVKIPIYVVTFEYSVVGQQMPQQPQVTLQFPNGTSTTITIYSGETIKVPAGTTYTFQQIISQGNVRWATQTLVTGVVKQNNSVISATYYEQVLVTFEYNVTNGKWTSTPPTVVYYNFTSKATVTLPAQVWVNYNSTYCYQNVTVGNERIITTNYKGVVTSPGIITVDYTLQYYVQVNSQIPVYAIVEGKNVSLNSGWYNAGITIQVENITYYPSPNVRYIITSISPSATVTVNSPITIQINTVEQFYVTVKVNMQFTIYALINGKNETLTSGWYNSGTTIQVENFTDYITNNTRYTIGSVTPSPTVTVNSPITIAVNIVKQFYVQVVSPIPVYALINGTNVLLNSGWYDAYSIIQIENISYSPSPGVRYIIVSVSPSTTIDLTSPITITVTTEKQFYVTVNSPIPVYALINGKNESLLSGWYNANTTIYIENLTYYPFPNERYVIVSISPSSTVTVNSPITIQINTVEQFYVTVKINSQFTVYALINGVNETLKSGWYNAGTVIQVENFTYYPAKDIRFTIVSVKPSMKITVNSPVTIEIEIAEQFYVQVNSPVPVHALINGVNETLVSNWYNNGTTIKVENLTYYPAKDVRYVIVAIKPSQEVIVTSPITINVTAVEQFYVQVVSPIPVYALINGKNESLISNWYNAGSQIQIENIPYYISNNTRYVISSVSPSANITVNSPVTIVISVQKQFYVTLVSPYPVYALINGVNGTLTSGWYNAGTTIYIENVTNYPAKGIRFFILSVEPSMNFTVNSPMTIKIKMEVQYYVTVNSKIPVYAIINGKNETLMSNWYNANTTIYIENLTYYPAKDVRCLILGIQPSQKIIVKSPITVNIIAVKQFYITVISPIPVYALINGKNESLISNWYNASSSIQVENITYYPAKGVRYVIVSVLPSETINLTSPITISVSAIKQYYVQVNSPIPVKAIINGTQTYLNSSWINQGTEIRIINYTYYTNGERYIITGISPQSFTVNSPITVNVPVEKQFLVTINGQQEWVNQGETITLTANVPIYETAEFVGTYNVSPGTTITVTSPISERLVLHPNYVFYGTIAGIAVIIITVLIRKKK